MKSRLLALLVLAVVTTLHALAFGQYRLPYSREQCTDCYLTTYPSFHGSRHTLDYLGRVRQYSAYPDHGGTDYSVPTTSAQLTARTWANVDGGTAADSGSSGDATFDALDAACVGSASQPCGNCGHQTRTCSGGAWSAWSACTGEGACAAGSTEACMGTGTRTCSSTCAWSACTGYCGGGTAREGSRTEDSMRTFITSFCLVLCVLVGCGGDHDSSATDAAAIDSATPVDTEQPADLPETSVLDAPTPPDTLDCPMGQTRCGDICVDTRADPVHCASCEGNCRALPGVNGLAVTCEQGLWRFLKRN